MPANYLEIKMNFINVIFNKINDENKNYIYFLFLLNTGIQILLCSVLSFSLSADSYHYLQRFDILNIKSLNPDNRSVGYPLFLYFLGTKTFWEDSCNNFAMYNGHINPNLILFFYFNID